MTRASLDIIIPARGEHAGIEACLAAILAAGPGVDLRVVVVANGPDWNLTLAAAARCEACFARANCTLIGLHSPRPGKTTALNLGDRHRRGCPIVYLDADVRLDPGALVAVAVALENPNPMLIAPRLRVRRSDDWIGRRFSAVWTALPAVVDDVGGGGCYAVNLAGRARWDSFPDIVADDAYVRSRFVRSERAVLLEAGIEIELPSWMHLPSAMQRWRYGNRQLRSIPSPEQGLEGSDPSFSAGANILWAVSRTDLWPSLPVYLVVWIASHFAPNRLIDTGWIPAR